VTDNNNCSGTEFYTIDKLSNTEDTSTCIYVKENVISSDLNFISCNGYLHKFNICDVSGKTLISGPVLNHEMISLKHLINGIYFVYIFNEENKIVYTCRIIKV
ncbi:MAG: T9SS type A sorting domain-containing protein, partial [Saprospiraceae bacterium]|nr:T9SS type A sorting domain-containing protein [Saprospiraceae bacterium]